jgi:hypothetical protein
MDVSMTEKTRYEGAVAIFYCAQFEDTPMHDWIPIKLRQGPEG